jgi:1-deoxy-D-xylulose-5-phosphate reductoisomerase
MLSYISSLDPAVSLSNNPRRIAVLGSTGSIGCNVLKVAAENPGRFEIVGLCGGGNIELLAEQAAAWRPPVLVVKDFGRIPQLQERLPADYSPEIMAGTTGYVSLATLPDADMVVSAQVGAVGLEPTLAAIRQGKVVALANKESLVLAGPLLRQACAESGGCILPVDSEHNAIFQALHGHDWAEVQSLVLTASGGPFWNLDQQALANVTVEQAVNHPNWSMGAKISIDSATLMNKGLEVIEACHLFGVGSREIEVVVHPESIVHSLVAYHDGSWLAHLGVPDMRVPIAYCLSFPKRLSLDLAPLDLVKLGNLRFSEPDESMFPCLQLARQAFEAGDSHPIALNAANEVSVAMFLDRRIGFADIPKLNEAALQALEPCAIQCLDDVLEVDAKARACVEQEVEKR